MLFNVDKALSLPDIRQIVAKRGEVLDRFGPRFRDPLNLTKQHYLDFLSFKQGIGAVLRFPRRAIGPDHFGLDLGVFEGEFCQRGKEGFDGGRGFGHDGLLWFGWVEAGGAGEVKVWLWAGVGTGGFTPPDPCGIFEQRG